MSCGTNFFASIALMMATSHFSSVLPGRRATMSPPTNFHHLVLSLHCCANVKVFQSAVADPRHPRRCRRRVLCVEIQTRPLLDLATKAGMLRYAPFHLGHRPPGSPDTAQTTNAVNLHDSWTTLRRTLVPLHHTTNSFRRRDGRSLHVRKTASPGRRRSTGQWARRHRLGNLPRPSGEPVPVIRDGGPDWPPLRVVVPVEIFTFLKSTSCALQCLRWTKVTVRRRRDDLSGFH